MDELEEYFENEFFIIDSNNLNTVKPRLYGYMINSQEIVQNDDFDEDTEIGREGAYILIDADESKISIRQDFNGSYGLYVFKSDGYFAISNSFLKLVNYLKRDWELSLNRDYADSFLFTNLTSIAYMDTMVNEIKSVPRHFTAHIDKTDGTIEYEKIDYGEKSVYLNSKEAFEIIDGWHDKWTNIIRSIKSKTNNLSVDLSGGFDTRITAALWIDANIDFDKFKIKSHNNTASTHEEDFKIASKIADFFNFKLNQNVPSDEAPYRFSEINTPLNNSFNLKLGFHKQMYFKTFRSKNPVYSITGEGGGSLRKYASYSRDDFLENKKRIIGKFDASLFEGAKKDINKALDEVIDNFNLDEDSDELLQMHYNETRSRYHFGKAAVESYFSNMITLTPLLDSDLRKLMTSTPECSDDKLLVAVIFSRFCPDLLKFEFDSGREIPAEVIEYAEKLNEKYPCVKKDLEYVSGPEINEAPVQTSDNYITRDDINNYLKEVFLSQKFEKEFEKYYPFNDYYSIMDSIDDEGHYPLGNVYSAIAIITIADAVEFSRINSCKKEYDWLNGFIDGRPENNNKRTNRHLAETFYTSRVDIKNHGDGNSVEILEISDKFAKVKFPEWFKNKEGEGCVVTSTAGSLKLKLKCVNDGTLKIRLRGENVKDKNDNPFPAFVDIVEFKVNDHDILENSELVSHNQLFNYEVEVKDGEMVDVQVIWQPFSKSSTYNLDYDKLDYGKFNYNKLNYEKINYDKLNYEKLDYEKINYEKLDYNQLNSTKLFKSKTKRIMKKS